MHDLLARREPSGEVATPLLAGDRAGVGLLQVTSPFDGSLIARINTCGEQHVEDALQAAWRQYRSRDMWLPLYERIGILERAARLMTRDHAALALLVSREAGKPLADSQEEATRAIDSLRLAMNEMKARAGNVVPMGSVETALSRIAFTHCEPVGVVVSVSSFHQPLNKVVHQVASAVAAGCPAIVKPSPETPLSCLQFVRILYQAGLPRELAQVVVTSDDLVTARLVTDKGVGLFSFIGPAKVGWRLRSKLAPGTRCTLEHSGVAPVILAQDANRELALKAILRGGFYHAGQDSVSVQRVYVPRKQARNFAETLAKMASELRLGNPVDSRTQVGPLIRPREVNRVHGWVSDAIAAGAVCLCGGAPRGECFYECTVLFEPPLSAQVSRKEIFGPVVCIYGYDEIEQAIDWANSLPAAFQAAVFTRDIDLAMSVYHRLDASAVMINDHTAFQTDGMPFAGLREAGLGVGGIPYSLRNMQIEKMLVFHSEIL